jgi:hypothetical protein
MVVTKQSVAHGGGEPDRVEHHGGRREGRSLEDRGGRAFSWRMCSAIIRIGNGMKATHIRNRTVRAELRSARSICDITVCGGSPR